MESYRSVNVLGAKAGTQFNLMPERPTPNILPWPHVPAHDATYSHEALKHARRNTFPPMQLGAAAADVGKIGFHPTRSPISLQQEGTMSTPHSKSQSVQCVLCQVALHSNEDIRDHLSTQQHSVAILQHPEVRLQDILIPESFVSEALRKGADPISEPSKTPLQTSSCPRKRGLVWSTENQQEEVNQIHKTSFKISDSEFELAKRMRLDVPHQQTSDLGPRYGKGRPDSNVSRYDSGRSECNIPRYEHGRSESSIRRYDPGRDKPNIPGYDSGRSKSDVSGYNAGKPNWTGFEGSFPRYDSGRTESNIPMDESRSSIPRYGSERSESSVSKYKKFESNTSICEFGRPETSFPKYNSGISVVERTSKSRSEGSHFESGAPNLEVRSPETTGFRHTLSKPEASSLLPPQESSVKETVIHCKVCDIAVPNQFHWGFHAKTKKHLQNMRVLEEGKEAEREREKREGEEERRKRVRAEEEEKERERMEEEGRLRMLKRRDSDKRIVEEREKVQTQRQSQRRVQERVMSGADRVMEDKWSAKGEDSTSKVTNTDQQQDSPGALPSHTTEGIHCHDCNFTIKNHNYWKAHVNSQRHKNRVTCGLRVEQQDLHESPFQCLLCDVSTNDESAFAQHMEGRRHRNNFGLWQSLQETFKTTQPQGSVVVSSSAAVQPIRSEFKLNLSPVGPSAITSSRQQSTPTTHMTSTVQPQTHKPLQNTSVKRASTFAQVKEKHSLSVTMPQVSEQVTKKGKVIRLKRPWRKNRSDDSSSVISSDSSLSGEPPAVNAAQPTKEHSTLPQTTSQEHFKVRSPTGSTQLVQSTQGLDQRQPSSLAVTTWQQPASTTTVQHQADAQLNPAHSSTVQQVQSDGASLPSQEGAKRAAAKCKLRQRAMHSAANLRTVESSQPPEPVSTTVAKVIPTGHTHTATGTSQQRQLLSPLLQQHGPLLPMPHRNDLRPQSSLSKPDLDRWEYEADKAYAGGNGYEMEVGSYEQRGVDSCEERGDEHYEERGDEHYEERGDERYEERGDEHYEERGDERYGERGDERFEKGGVESYEERNVVERYVDRDVERYDDSGVERYKIGKSEEHYRPEDLEGDALEFEIHPDTPDFDQYQDNTLSFDLHAKINPENSRQYSSESHTRVFGPDSQFREDSSRLDFSYEIPQRGFSSTQAPAQPRSHNGSRDLDFSNTDSTYTGAFSADLKQRRFATSVWGNRAPPFKSPRPMVNSPSGPGSLDGGSNSSQTRSTLPAAKTTLPSPANWLLTDTTGRLRSVETINYHHGWSQASDSAQQPGFKAQPQPSFKAQPQPSFKAQPQPGFEAQPQPGFRAQPQPGFRAQTQPGFRAQTQPGFEAQPQPGFRAQTQPGFEAQPQPGFRAQMQQHPFGTAVYQKSPSHSRAVQLKEGQFEAHRHQPAAVPQTTSGWRSSGSGREHTWQQEQQPHVDRFHNVERSTGQRWPFEHRKYPNMQPNKDVPSQPKSEFPYFSGGSFNTQRYQTF